MDQDYIQINRNVLSESAIGSFDIYCVADNNEMILSDPTVFLAELASHDRLASSPQEALYIHTKEREYYDLYVEARFHEFLFQEGLEVHEKVDIAREVINRLAEEFFEMPDYEMLCRFKQAISATIGYVIQEKLVLSNIDTIINADFGLCRHSVNVGIIGSLIAIDYFGVSSSHNIEEIAIAMFLHDIGFSTIPLFREIISSPEKFTSSDWELVHQHPKAGHEMLASIEEATNETEIIQLQHHERHDGSGYPFGLKAKQIHPYAEICMVADMFDGLTSKRPYHPQVNTFKAISIIKRDLFPHIPAKMFSSLVQLFVS